jgi:hypothetical protein
LMTELLKRFHRSRAIRRTILESRSVYSRGSPCGYPIGVKLRSGKRGREEGRKECDRSAHL